MQNMMGYYSLIQFCPNPLRLEAANIGLVLFVPESKFVQARINPNNDLVRRFFGNSFNDDWLKAAKNSIKERVEKSSANFQNLEDFRKFINTRTNEVLLTPPKPVKINDPNEMLNSLYEELVFCAPL